MIVDEEYRGEGIGKELIETLTNDEDLIHVRGLLITKDAKKFYEKFGFYNKEDVMQKDKKVKVIFYIKKMISLKIFQ